MAVQFPGNNPNRRRGLNQLSRQAERGLGVLLVSAAFAAGYVLPHSGNRTPNAKKATPGIIVNKPPKPKTAHHPKIHHGSTGDTKATMEKPLSPRGGEWNAAEAAALDAGDDGDNNYAQDDRTAVGIKNTHIRALAEQAVQTAEAATLVLNAQQGPVGGPNPNLGEITIPSLKRQTITALQESTADIAALDAANDDFSSAESLLGHISIPRIAAQVRLTIRQERAGNNDAAISAWSNIDNTVTNEWSNLDTAATSAWDTLNRHTDEYWQMYGAAPAH